MRAAPTIRSLMRLPMMLSGLWPHGGSTLARHRRRASTDSVSVGRTHSNNDPRRRSASSRALIRARVGFRCLPHRSAAWGNCSTCWGFRASGRMTRLEVTPAAVGTFCATPETSDGTTAPDRPRQHPASCADVRRGRYVKLWGAFMVSPAPTGSAMKPARSGASRRRWRNRSLPGGGRQLDERRAQAGHWGIRPNPVRAIRGMVALARSGAGSPRPSAFDQDHGS
jgi:hypothetical protein